MRFPVLPDKLVLPAAQKPHHYILARSRIIDTESFARKIDECEHSSYLFHSRSRRLAVQDTWFSSRRSRVRIPPGSPCTVIVIYMALQKVLINLPLSESSFEELTSLLSECGKVNDKTFAVKASKENFLPKLELIFDSNKSPTIDFYDKKLILSQPISNQTSETKKSPHNYQHLPLQGVARRIASAGKITTIDHLGVNFPWFQGLSPALKDFRNRLPGLAAYFRFPTGQDWDFILPATEQEIHSDMINLDITRRPKLELVSFEKCSTPIVQIDCITTVNFNRLKELFPEGIVDEELKNVWVYITTDIELDLCLVLNQPTKSDWSSFFSGHRLDGNNSLLE